MKLLIRKGRLVDPVGGIGGVMDILIEDGKLAVIGSDLREPEARVIDARGLNVCAGLVDMHVHLREPGFEYKETVETGALAAARGGFRFVFKSGRAFFNGSQTVDDAALEEQHFRQ